MIIRTLTTLIAVLWCLNAAAMATNDFSSSKIDIESTILNETRDITVYFPSDYQTNKSKPYDVLYMLDAGNDDVLAATTINRLASEQKKKGLIVVAINNIRRGYDFTPNYLELGRGDNRRNGNGDNFAAFITTELMPTIDNKYNTSNRRFFMGHSWGGAFSSYMLSQHPNLFNGFFIFSPSFINIPANENNDDKLSQDFITNIKTNTSIEFVYLSVGDAERQRFKTSYQGFNKFLKAQLPSRIKFVTVVNKGADHMANPEVSIPKSLGMVF